MGARATYLSDSLTYYAVVAGTGIEQFIPRERCLPDAACRVVCLWRVYVVCVVYRFLGQLGFHFSVDGDREDGLNLRGTNSFEDLLAEEEV